MSSDRLTYVWAARDMPEAGIRQGDHLLVREVIDEHQRVYFYWQSPVGQIWAISPSHVHETRMSGFLAGNGPIIMTFIIIAFAVVYFGWHIAKWAA